MEEYKELLKGMLGDEYESFISSLKDMSKDPKFLSFLHEISSNKDWEMKLDTKLKFIPCKHLVPTQNEVDLSKSLAFPLTSEGKALDGVVDVFNGGNTTPGGPIIVYNNKYVIDGHHRWSQIYCLNPNAKIGSYNFTSKSDLDPENVLKAIQMELAKLTGEIVTKSVEGDNLFTIRLKKVMEYVEDIIKDEVVDKILDGVKELDDKEDIVEVIASNVKLLQKFNLPFKGSKSPSRGFMPQTDEIINDSKKLKEFKDDFEDGKVVTDPESKNFTKIRKRNTRMKTLKIRLHSLKETRKYADSEWKVVDTTIDRGVVVFKGTQEECENYAKEANNKAGTYKYVEMPINEI